MIVVGGVGVGVEVMFFKCTDHFNVGGGCRCGYAFNS